jgi:hypothetical protein
MARTGLLSADGRTPRWSRDPSSPDRVNYGDPVRGKRDHDLRMTYALRLDQHDLILAEQDGLCYDAKCAQPFDDAHPPVVDHCHTTGEIFGLLHDACGALPLVPMGVCWLPAATTQPRGSGMWPLGRNSPKPPMAIGWRVSPL